MMGIEATVHDISDILKTNKGERVIGMLKDGTGKIDFVAWGPNASKIKGLLTVGETYRLHPLKVNSCIARFCHTPSLLQVTFTNDTNVERLNVKPFEDVVELTPLKDLPQNTLVNLNIAGKITDIYKDEDSNDKTTVVLRDEDSSIKISLYAAAGNTFSGHVGDVVVFENVVVKNYGACYLINGTNCMYAVNPKGDHLKFLYDIRQESHININLSPDKKKATQIRSLDCLMERNSLQEVLAEPIEVIIDCYHCCPALGCRKKMKENEKSKTFACDKCNKIYIASATGLCAKIMVSADNTMKTFTMFNENAEKFFNISGNDIMSQGITCEKLLERVQSQYMFTVTGGRKENEFLVSKFRKVEICDAENKAAQSEPRVVQQGQETNTMKDPSHHRNRVKTSIKRLLSTTGFDSDTTSDNQQNSTVPHQIRQPVLSKDLRLSQDPVPQFDSEARKDTQQSSSVLRQKHQPMFDSESRNETQSSTVLHQICQPMLTQDLRPSQDPVPLFDLETKYETQQSSNVLRQKHQPMFSSDLRLSRDPVPQFDSETRVETQQSSSVLRQKHQPMFSSDLRLSQDPVPQFGCQNTPLFREPVYMPMYRSHQSTFLNVQVADTMSRNTEAVSEQNCPKKRKTFSITDILS